MNSTRLALSLLLLGACGPKAPTHSGYPTGLKEPWTKAKIIALDDSNKAKEDGTLSYPERTRARWYVIELPTDGILDVKLTVDPQTQFTSGLGFEILDSGYNIVAGKRDDEEDGGGAADDDSLKKVLIVKDARAGDSYIHLYTLGKTDAADYSLKINFTPAAAAIPVNTFPNNVPMPGEIAAVPAADDAPPKHGKSSGGGSSGGSSGGSKTSGGSSGGSKTPGGTTPGGTTPGGTTDANGAKSLPKGGVIAMIVEYSDSGGGTRVVIDRGKADGVTDGAFGYVFDKSKKKIAGSDFSVKSIREHECEGVVPLPTDVVKTARTVLLKPPK